MSAPPIVVILAGPNGAGKSTAAPAVLQGTLEVTEFVNADDIARGLSAFNPEGAAIAAGRVMLARLSELAEQRISFAFETTLASRSFAPRLKELKTKGYRVHLVFFWLPSADLAVNRVADRTAMGGHHVPAETVKRRYRAGIQNFLALYRPLASSWRLYNSGSSPPTLIARFTEHESLRVYDTDMWESICQEHEHDEG